MLKPQDFHILGRQLDNPRKIFNYPTSSKDIGIAKGTQFLESNEMVALIDIKCKCMLLRIDKEYHVITLLHTYDK